MRISFGKARRALDFLERHELEPSSANYSYALLYVKSASSALAREVDSAIYGGARLTPEALAGIVHRFSPASSSADVDQRERTVARQAEQLGTLTSDAHDITESLGRDVGALAGKPEDWPSDAHQFVDRLSEAERELSELRREFQALRNEIGTTTAARPEKDGRDDLTKALGQDGGQKLLDSLRKQNRPYVILLFIVDDLAAINNQFGRSVGDNVLNAFAATLREVFPDDELMRWSGNEFVIITNNISGTAARLLAEDVLSAFRARRLKLRGTGQWIGTVTASAGIAIGSGEAPDTALADARSNALLAATQGGDQTKG